MMKQKFTWSLYCDLVTMIKILGIKDEDENYRIKYVF